MSAPTASHTLGASLHDTPSSTTEDDELSAWCLVSGRATIAISAALQPSGASDNAAPACDSSPPPTHTFTWSYPKQEVPCAEVSHCPMIATAVCDLSHSPTFLKNDWVRSLEISAQFVPRWSSCDRTNEKPHASCSDYCPLPFVWAQLRSDATRRQGEEEAKPRRCVKFVVPNVHYWRGETPLSSTWVATSASLGSDDAQEFTLTIDDVVTKLEWPTLASAGVSDANGSKNATGPPGSLEVRFWLPTRRTVRKFFAHIRSYVARRQLADDIATAAEEWASVAAEVGDPTGRTSSSAAATWSRRSPESAFLTAVQHAVASAPLVRLRDGSDRLRKLVAYLSGTIVFRFGTASVDA